MKPHTALNDDTQDIADDVLIGADEIGRFLFGPNPNGSRRNRRKVYYLASHTRIPVFRLGAVLHARRSVLLEWISTQEKRALPPRS